MVFIFSSEQQQPYNNDNTKRHDIENKPFWQKLFPDSISFFNFSLVLVTGALVVIGITQANAAKTAADAAKQSADALINAERPHMLISQLSAHGIQRAPDDDGNVKISINYKFINFGRSPALLKASCIMQVVLYNLPEVPIYGEPNKMRFILAPHTGHGNIKPIEEIAEASIIAKLVSGDEHFFIFGFLKYNDVFGNGHITRFAYRIMFGAGDSSEGFIPDGPDSYWEYT